MIGFIEDEYRVLVCGGRDYQDRYAVFKALDNLAEVNNNMIIIHGACCFKDHPLDLRGADRWAHEYGLEREVPVIAVPAKWHTDSNNAGPLRNDYMLVRFLPSLVVAFPGGNGTAHMVKLARSAGVRVWEPVKQPSRKRL